MNNSESRRSAATPVPPVRVKAARGRTLLMLLFGMLFTAAACGDGSAPFGPGESGLRLTFEASYTVADSEALPITHIRLVGRQAGTALVLGRALVAVNGMSQDVELAFGIDLPDGRPTFVVVLVELLNITNGVESVQWSGMFGPIEVVPGRALSAQRVALVRGDLQNLGITSISIQSAAPIQEGTDLQLAAVVIGAANPTVVWTSLDGEVAAVNGTGLVRGIRAGTARIVATGGLRADTAVIQVRQRLDRLVIDPGGHTFSALGAEATLTARALDPRGEPIAGLAFEWDIAADAPVESLGGGRFRARSNGTATVTARTTFNGQPFSATAELRVQQAAASLTLEPQSIQLTAIGATRQVTVTARDANGNALVPTGLVWTAGNPLVATVSASGLVTAVGTGTTHVRAASGNVHAEVEVEVAQRVTRLAISPNGAFFRSLYEQATFSAVAHDAQGQVVPGVKITWMTAVEDGVIGVDNGVVTALANGNATLIAVVQDVRAWVGILVEQEAVALRIEPGSAEIAGPGQQQQFTGVGVDGNGFDMPIAQGSWSVDNTGVATIDETGLVTATGPGETTVRLAVGGASATAALRVEGASNVASVVVLPDQLFIPLPGEERTLTVMAYGPGGSPLPGLTAQWSSSDPAVAVVSQAGIVRAVGPGIAIITARVQGVAGTAEVRVGAETPPTAGRDVVVFNDLNVFDNTGMLYPSNRTMARNLVLFDAGGPRAVASRVWIDKGRSSRCPECSTSRFETEVQSAGMKPEIVFTSSGTMVQIPLDVKVIMLWLPLQAFQVNEINALKQFAAEGGRVIFVGEYDSYYGAAGLALQNKFLTDMGAVMRNIGQARDCGFNDLPATSLRPHQVTAGMTGVRVACASVIEPGPEDFPLFYDRTNTRVLAGVAKIDTRPIQQSVGGRGLELMGVPRGILPLLPRDPNINPASSTGR